MTDTAFTFMAEVPQNRRPLDVWKERHSVVAVDLSDITPDYWVATRVEGLDMLAGHGPDEESACFDLARQHKLPWLESISQADLQPRLPGQGE